MMHLLEHHQEQADDHGQGEYVEHERRLDHLDLGHLVQVVVRAGWLPAEKLPLVVRSGTAFDELP